MVQFKIFKPTIWERRQYFKIELFRNCMFLFSTCGGLCNIVTRVRCRYDERNRWGSSCWISYYSCPIFRVFGIFKQFKHRTRSENRIILYTYYNNILYPTRVWITSNACIILPAPRDFGTFYTISNYFKRAKIRGPRTYSIEGLARSAFTNTSLILYSYIIVTNATGDRHAYFVSIYL